MEILILKTEDELRAKALLYAPMVQTKEEMTTASASMPVTNEEAEVLLASIKEKNPGDLLKLELGEVIALLRVEGQKRRRCRALTLSFSAGIMLLFLVLAAFKHNPMFITMYGSYSSLIVVALAASQKQKSASIALARFDDVRAIGPLAEALEFRDKTVTPIAAQALKRLLPRLQASDSPLLNAAQRACLNRALNGKDAELTIAILKAWEQVGDESAISPVKRLTEGIGRGARNSMVVAAAQECLPFLFQSASRQQVGSQLLRAADEIIAPFDDLLRPAMPRPSSDPTEQLLRPTNGNAL